MNRRSFFGACAALAAGGAAVRAAPGVETLVALLRANALPLAGSLVMKGRAVGLNEWCACVTMLDPSAPIGIARSDSVGGIVSIDIYTGRINP